MHSKSFIVKLIGILIFIIILTKIDLSKSISILKNMNLYLLLLAILFIFPIVLIKTVRWQLILKALSINYSLPYASLMYFSGLYIGIITPGRLGELAKVLYLTKDKHSAGKAFLSVFVDRIADLLFLLTFGFLGFFAFSNLFIHQIVLLTAISSVMIFALIIIIMFHKQILYLVRMLIHKTLSKRFSSIIDTAITDFFTGLKSITHNTYITILLLTLLSWLIYYIQMYLLTSALHFQIPFWYLAGAVTISGLITLLPISISGIGTRDVILITLFAALGIASEYALSLSFLILLMSLFAALFGSTAFFAKPIKL